MMTYRTQLRDIALEQHGYFTVRDAATIGVPAAEVRKLAARGSLQRVGHAVYRMLDVPVSEADQLALAVLLVGRDAHLTQDAVLALHGLALVNPRRIRVGTPHRIRTALPGFVQMIREHLPDGDLTTYLGIRSATVARALVDCAGLVMLDRLRTAARNARTEGLLTRAEAVSVRQALGQGTLAPVSNRK